MENKVRVSVLMPIYNTSEEMLRESIDSILAQTFKAFEFLILNDSPDNKSLSLIVQSYNDPRIKYFENEKNIGISASRNWLLDLSAGEYIAVMDHDDISMPQRFSKQVEYLDAHSEVGVVSCFHRRFGEDKVLGEVIKYPTSTDEISKGLVLGGCYLLHPASMIRKKVLEETRLCYEEYFSPSEDYALWCRLIGKTKFHNIPEDLFHYRDFGGNTTYLQSDKMKTRTSEIYDFVRKEQIVLFNETKKRKTHLVRFLGITILKIEKSSMNKRVSLFGFIPLLTVKKRILL